MINIFLQFLVLLLFFSQFFDFIILVAAPRESRLNRYLKSGGTKEMFKLLDENQISPRKKIKYCDFKR